MVSAQRQGRRTERRGNARALIYIVCKWFGTVGKDRVAAVESGKACDASCAAARIRIARAISYPPLPKSARAFNHSARYNLCVPQEVTLKDWHQQLYKEIWPNVIETIPLLFSFLTDVMPARMMSARGGAGGAADVSVADSPLPTFESLTQAAVIAVMGVAIVVSNLLIIAAFLNFKGLSNEVINYYLLSLAVADLVCGVFVVPLSVYPALTGRWMFGDLMCRLAGYVEVTLWSVSVYTFMWISVDRYLAVRKPLRYETVQTRTRSQCWMVFTWISAAMLCCPPLLGYKKEANFDKETLICMLDWGTTYAYTATLGILVLGPSVISIVYNYFYIFSMKRKLASGAPIHDKEYATALAENLSNPSHWMSFMLVCAFWLSWAPYAGVRLYEYIIDKQINIPMLHFGVVWLGILNSFWKIVILISCSPQFRLALRILCLTACCRTKGRLQAELLGMDNDD